MEKVLKSEDSYDKNIEKFKKLKELDNQLCDIGYSLLKSLLLFRKTWFPENQPNASKIIGIAGSTSEGSTSARVFKPSVEFDDGLNRELEADVDFILLEIPPELKNYVEDIPDKIGYVNVCIHPEILRLKNNVDLGLSNAHVEEYLAKVNAEGYASPYNIKTFLLKKYKLQENRKVFEIVSAALFDEKISNISLTKSEKVTNASVGSEYIVQIKNKNVLKLSVDLVNLIRIYWWPDVASEWKERKRNWPDVRTIDDLTQTCHIIAKPSAAEKGNTETLDWKYSFSDVERKLISMYNPQQKLVYFIFKAMFYKWLKPIDPTQLSSFIGKNIMLKTAEEYPPHDKMWNETSEALKRALVYLFVQMQKAFESNCLPYYFMNKINVIETIDPEVQKEVLKKTEWIIDNIEECIPSNVNDVIVFVEDMIQRFNYFDKILLKLLKKNYSDFFNLKFVGSNLDTIFNEIVLSSLKDATEIKNVREMILNCVTDIKSAVPTEDFKVEIVNEKIKLVVDKLVTGVSKFDPDLPNATHEEVLRLEADVIEDGRQLADRVVNKVANVVDIGKSFLDIFRF